MSPEQKPAYEHVGLDVTPEQLARLRHIALRDGITITDVLRNAMHTLMQRDQQLQTHGCHPPDHGEGN